MKIKIRRTGGFAGIDQELATLDATHLEPAQAQLLRRHATELTRLARQRPRPIGADQFQYEVDISEPDAAPTHLSIVDQGNPDDPAIKKVLAMLELAGSNRAAWPPN